MAQIAKVIDVTRSYIPIDPNAFPETYHATNKEDYPEERVPVVPYEGYNFLPTAYGYKSYFGTNRKLNIDDLESRCDKIFVLQTPTYQNKLIALCEDGIWTKTGTEIGAWVQEVSLTVPAEGEHLDWTYCVIERVLFCYRAGEAFYWRADDTLTYAAQDASVMTLSHDASSANTTGVPVGTFDYSIARVDTTTGNLSLPSTAVPVTYSAISLGHFSFAPVANTDYYRIYREDSLGAVTYFDIPHTGGTLQYWVDVGDTGTAVVMPDLTVREIDRNYYEFYAVTPTFLNMEGQLGIFKAGLRLGFWDSENSFAWSSIDDFADLEPSLTTLAGSSIFGEVSGRVVTVLGYEQGFIIYALNSIVHIRQKVDATFQWQPDVLLDRGGILYPEQAVAGILPEQHFAWTSKGLVRIAEGRLEITIPEVYDYFRESLEPITLHLLEGRYLVIQTMDEGYIDARVGFSWGSVPASTYVFPGTEYIADLIPGTTISSSEVCLAGAAVSDGATSEQQAMAAAAGGGVTTPAKKAGTTFTPIYNCYISGKPIPAPGDITWGAVPCTTVDPNGVEKNMCPVGDAGKTSLLGTGPTGKTLSPSSDWLIGNWTFERFVAVQMAIWRLEDERRAAYIAALLGRTGFGTKTSVVASCSESDVSADCLIGEYLLPASYNVSWGINQCSFWLTRIFENVIDIYRRKNDVVSCSSDGGYTSPIVEATFNYWNGGATWCSECAAWFDWPTSFASMEDAESLGQAMYDAYNSGLSAFCPPTPHFYTGFSHVTYPESGVATVYFTYSSGSADVGAINISYTCPTGYSLTTVDGAPICQKTSTYTKVEQLNAFNHGKTKQTLIIDQPYCELTGWSYTDVDGATQFKARGSDSCTTPDPDDPAPPAPQLLGGDPKQILALDGPLGGRICNNPFPTITIPDYSPDPIVWPEQTVTLPGDTFLLQQGSIGPIYPDFKGAFVYDLLLKKWGKMKCFYRQLLDYRPINAGQDGIISDVDVEVKAGILNSNGEIYLFDETPLDSYIKYGKIGYYRLGMTSLEEVKVHFRTNSTGVVQTETSLNGESPEGSLTSSTAFTDTKQAKVAGSISGRWHNVSISGHYDIKHLEYRGNVSGRR